jgi:hypothetical protein
VVALARAAGEWKVLTLKIRHSSKSHVVRDGMQTLGQANGPDNQEVGMVRGFF